MRDFWTRHYGPEVDLRYRMFCLCALLGTMTSFLGFVVCLVLNGPAHPIVLATGGAFLGMLGLTAYGYRSRRIDTVTIIMSIALNFVVFPVAFFVSGGLYSVAPLFFVMGIFIALPLLRGRKRLVLFTLEMVYYAGVILLCAAKPELSFFRPVEIHATMLLFSFLIVVFYIFSSTIMVTRQYEKERQKALRLNELLAEQAIRDPLTGLYNRRYLTDTLDARIAAGDDDFAVVILDLDDFKVINDTYGHLFGDDVLIKLTEIMSDAVGELGFVCRFGGEEFLLCFCGVGAELPRRTVEEIRRIFAAWFGSKTRGRATFSAGLALYRKGEPLTAFFSRADASLYEAKQGGKNTLVFHP